MAMRVGAVGALLVAAAGGASAQLPQPPAAELATVDVRVDAEVELLSIIQVIGGRMENGLDFGYKQRVLDHFGRFKEHRAVEMIRTLAPTRFSWAVPAALGVHLGPLPALAVPDSLPTQLSERATTQAEVAEYVAAARDFARVSGFDAFFRANQPFYDTLTATVRATMRPDSIAADAQRYFGSVNSSFHVYLSPLMPAGGVGPRVTARDGSMAAYSVLGFGSVRDGYPVVGSILGELVAHEFGHSFVNPVVERHKAEFDRYALLLSPVRNRLARYDGIDEWSTAVMEMVLRSASALSIRRTEGDSAMRAYVDRERKHGMVYLDAFVGAMEEYEGDRTRYPTLAHLMPRLLDLSRSLITMPLPVDSVEPVFTGDLTLARWNSDDRTEVWIVPTAEQDRAEQDTLHARIRALRQLRDSSVFVVTDVEALQMDLSRATLYVYGTPQGNRWLAAHRSDIPFTIGQDEIVADSAYRGTGLVLVAALRNPRNPRRAMVVTTGQRVLDIAQANRSWRSDYAIVRGSTLVARGSYPVKTRTLLGFARSAQTVRPTATNP